MALIRRRKPIPATTAVVTTTPEPSGPTPHELAFEHIRPLLLTTIPTPQIAESYLDELGYERAIATGQPWHA